MIYLIILFLVGGVGIGSLMVQQRRERAHLQSADSFLASLEKIAPEARPGPFAETRVPRSRPVTAGRSRKARAEAKRRAVARRRLEARRARARERAPRAHGAHSRSAAPARRRARAGHRDDRRHPAELRQSMVQEGRPTRPRRVS